MTSFTVGTVGGTESRLSCADAGAMLSFQRLDIYQRSIQFLAFASDLVEELPRGNAERADQLIRAAEAVPRNIAEGAGRWSKVEMSKHSKIARGEAMECAASLDVYASSSSLATSAGSSSWKRSLRC